MSFESAPPPPPSSMPEPATLAEEKTWSVWSHAGPLVAGLVSLPGFIVPLVIMLTKGKTSARIRRNAVESLNFQLTTLIAFIALVIPAWFSLGSISEVDGSGFGGLLLMIGIAILLGLACLVMQIIAIVRVSNNEDFKYPINIRIVK